MMVFVEIVSNLLVEMASSILMTSKVKMVMLAFTWELQQKPQVIYCAMISGWLCCCCSYSEGKYLGT